MNNNTTKEYTMYYQTGDVLYHKISKKPTGFKKAKGNLIHQGNDHKHTIKGDFELYVKDDEMIIITNKACLLQHEEHKDVKLPKGIYKKAIVMEYDHFKEEARKVID